MKKDKFEKKCNDWFKRCTDDLGINSQYVALIQNPDFLYAAYVEEIKKGLKDFTVHMEKEVGAAITRAAAIHDSKEQINILIKKLIKSKRKEGAK